MDNFDLNLYRHGKEEEQKETRENREGKSLLYSNVFVVHSNRFQSDIFMQAFDALWPRFLSGPTSFLFLPFIFPTSPVTILMLKIHVQI